MVGLGKMRCLRDNAPDSAWEKVPTPKRPVSLQHSSKPSVFPALLTPHERSFIREGGSQLSQFSGSRVSCETPHQDHVKVQ
jgi:hypothetical protein